MGSFIRLGNERQLTPADNLRATNWPGRRAQSASLWREIQQALVTRLAHMTDAAAIAQRVPNVGFRAKWPTRRR
jgi:hypothetical protein